MLLLFGLNDLSTPSVAAPIILANPQNQSVLAGGTATFVVVAQGVGLNYTWYKSGVAVLALNAPSYSAVASASDNGASITVTVSNSAGSATSAAAILSVVSPQIVSAGTVAPVGPFSAPGPVGICNLACTMLGAETITSLQDTGVTPRAFNAVYDLIRQAELRAHRWRFAISRTKLPASTTVPASGPWTLYFPLPADYLHVLEVGDSWPGADLSDYRTMPTTEGWAIEGRQVATCLAAPLSFKYVKDVTDTTQFDVCFVTALAAKLAWSCCERITSSTEKRKFAAQEYAAAISAAIKANALELIPEHSADDSWIMSRLQ